MKYIFLFFSLQWNRIVIIYEIIFYSIRFPEEKKEKVFKKNINDKRSEVIVFGQLGFKKPFSFFSFFQSKTYVYIFVEVIRTDYFVEIEFFVSTFVLRFKSDANYYNLKLTSHTHYIYTD